MKTKLIPITVVATPKPLKKFYVAVFVDFSDGVTFTHDFKKKPTRKEMHDVIDSTDNNVQIVALLEFEK